MKYTIEELEKKSDFELNSLIAERYIVGEYVISEDQILHAEINYQMMDGVHTEFLSPVGTFNPCGCWDDIGNLITENKIIVDGSGRAWVSQGFERYKHFNESNNPLRAAAIVYLMLEG